MTPKGLIFRLAHTVLHILVIAFILIGFCLLPPNSHNDTILRALAWVAFECFYLLISLAVSAYSFCVILAPNKMPGFFERIHSSNMLNNCPDVNFFYYAIMSVFVLYGTMLGCHIPALFITLNGKPDPLQGWRISLWAAVALSATNAIIYSITGFIPLEKEEGDGVSTVGAKTPRRSNRASMAPGEGEEEVVELEKDMGMDEVEVKVEVKVVPTEDAKEVRSNESQKAKVQ